jgi:hypothetical protein
MYKLTLNEKVRFHGWIAHQDINRFYLQADFLVHTSLHEGECCVIEEALALGLPVIASRVGIANDVIIHGENGFLFSPGDKNGLYEVLSELPHRVKTCNSYSEAAYKTAEEKLDRSRSIQKLMQIYNEMKLRKM